MSDTQQKASYSLYAELSPIFCMIFRASVPPCRAEATAPGGEGRRGGSPEVAVDGGKQQARVGVPVAQLYVLHMRPQCGMAGHACTARRRGAHGPVRTRVLPGVLRQAQLTLTPTYSITSAHVLCV